MLGVCNFLLRLRALRRQQVSRARPLLHLEPQDGRVPPVRHRLQRRQIVGHRLEHRRIVNGVRVRQRVQEAEEEHPRVQEERHQHRAAPGRERLRHERVAGHEEQRDRLPELRAVVHAAGEEQPEGEGEPRVEQVLQQGARARAPADAVRGALCVPQGVQRPARHPQRQDRAQQGQVDGHGRRGEQERQGLARQQVRGQVHDVRGKHVQHAIGPARVSLVYT